jgi:hypothetical protein
MRRLWWTIRGFTSHACLLASSQVRSSGLRPYRGIVVTRYTMGMSEWRFLEAMLQLYKTGSEPLFSITIEAHSHDHFFLTMTMI